MSKVIKVGMADLNICKSPDTITTIGLGSCIGLTFYDPVAKIGGMVHYMLPDSTQMNRNGNIAKYADTGASRNRLVAKMAGGAKMFQVSGASNVSNIGERNALAAKAKLRELRIRLIAEDTGLNYGRTVELDCETGDFYVKAIGKPVKII